MLYKRPPNKYILHRIIEVRENDYVILGDNCIDKEYGIKDIDIIGIMTSYVRNGKEHSINERRYRLYTGFILTTNPVRVFFKKIWVRIKRLLKKVLRRK